MSDEKRKLEPPLRLDIPFEEAMLRYAQTDPEEVEPPKGKRPKVSEGCEAVGIIGRSETKAGAQRSPRLARTRARTRRSSSHGALRLKNGVKSATDGDLDQAVSWLESFELFCGGVVVFGVLMEVGIAVVHPSYDSTWGTWGSAISDIFVLAGVFGEVMASARVTLCQGEILQRPNKLLSEAKEEASSAFAEAILAGATADKLPPVLD